MSDSTQRFSSRVQNYSRYRPGYPNEVIGLLQRECGLAPASVVADIGSGTGLLSELFLKHGCLVYGVEPNPEMRAAGERRLSAYPNFRSVPGTAEATALPDASVELITAGQSFHWFDGDRARAEFARLLKPGGWVAILWSVRRTDTPFMACYEAINHVFGINYAEVTHRQVNETVLAAFFAPGTFEVARFPHEQVFDYAGLEGRLLSSSYTPEAGHPNHAPMLAELRRLFDAHQSGGRVVFKYEAQVYYGQLKERVTMIPQPKIPDRSEQEQFTPAMVYVRQPARWEYRRLARDLNEKEAFTEEELNALGAEGWELIAVVALPIELQAYFKRLKK